MEWTTAIGIASVVGGLSYICGHYVGFRDRGKDDQARIIDLKDAFDAERAKCNDLERHLFVEKSFHDLQRKTAEQFITDLQALIDHRSKYEQPPETYAAGAESRP